MNLDTYNENYVDLGTNKVHITAIISDKAKIGKGNIIEAGVIIKDNVEIGNNNYIGAYTIIGDIPESTEYFSSYTGSVKIGNNCRLTKKITIDGGTTDVTVLCDDVVMLVNSHIGHDAFIWNNVSIRCGAVIGGFCQIERFTNIGVNAFIHQRITVPQDCFIGAGCVVTKQSNLTPGYIYVGVPAKQLKKNVRNISGNR